MRQAHQRGKKKRPSTCDDCKKPIFCLLSPFAPFLPFIHFQYCLCQSRRKKSLLGKSSKKKSKVAGTSLANKSNGASSSFVGSSALMCKHTYGFHPPLHSDSLTHSLLLSEKKERKTKGKEKDEEVLQEELDWLAHILSLF